MVNLKKKKKAKYKDSRILSSRENIWEVDREEGREENIEENFLSLSS